MASVLQTADTVPDVKLPADMGNQQTADFGVRLWFGTCGSR